MAPHHSRQQKVLAHPANKKEKNYPTAFRRKFYTRFKHVSNEHTSHSSPQTKKVHAHPPLKKRVVDAIGHPLQDLRKRYKGELTTLWPLLTEIKKLHPNPQHNDLLKLVKMCEKKQKEFMSNHDITRAPPTRRVVLSSHKTSYKNKKVSNIPLQQSP